MGCIFALRLLPGLKSGKRIDVGRLNLSRLEDGVYKGEFRRGRWTNKVEVTVSSNKITDINVIGDVVFSDPKISKQVIDTIIEEQSLQIDTVSGATVTTKAYLKAVENALRTD